MEGWYAKTAPAPGLAPALPGLEALMDAAWPAPDREESGGWALRAASGVTQRANSLWPREPEGGTRQQPGALRAARVECGPGRARDHTRHPVRRFMPWRGQTTTFLPPPAGWLFPAGRKRDGGAGFTAWPRVPTPGGAAMAGGSCRRSCGKALPSTWSATGCCTRQATGGWRQPPASSGELHAKTTADGPGTGCRNA